MIRLIRAEVLKLRTTQVWLWLLLADIAVGALVAIGSLAPHDAIKESKDVPFLFATSNSALLTAFVLGVLGITTEFRYQTITPTVLATPSRWTVVTAKMLAYLIVGIGYALACTAVMLAVAVPWLHTLGLSVDFGDWDVLRAIGSVFLVLALFGTIGLGFGALVRNQIVAVSVGVIFLLVLNQILLAIPGVRVIYPYTPNGAVTALFVISGDRTSDGVTLLSPAAGIAVLVGYAVVPAVIGASLTLNRDIT